MELARRVTKFYLCTRLKTIKLSLYFPGRGRLAQTHPAQHSKRELLVLRVALRIN